MGKVFLVGAGPGDPELMTLKAARVLREAGVVLVDELVSPGCLSFVRPGAKIIRVGKRGGCKSTPQAFIARLMVRYAKQGSTVARLKGGDPFVFGRGGEELEALRAAGVEAEVIPGVTAGIAAPAALGIPVTHRDVVRGVTFVTGHTRDGAEPDWRALACSGTTLVIYMGLKNCTRILRALRHAGMDPFTPACIIGQATLPSQAARVASLATLDATGFVPPALIVVGDVVAFCDMKPALERAA